MPTPVVFIHGLWLHATSWTPWLDLLPRGGVRADGSCLARRIAYRRRDAREPRSHGRQGDRRHRQSLHGHHQVARFAADPRRPFVRWADRREAPGARQGNRGGRHRSRADQRRPPLAARSAAVGAPRPRQPGEPSSSRGPQQEGVPIRVRQRALGGGVRRAVREMDHPVPCAAALPGCCRQLRAALRGPGQHEEQQSRSSAAHLGYRRPHRSGRGHAVDDEAVPPLDRGDGAQAVRRAAATPSPSTAGGKTSPTRCSAGSKKRGSSLDSRLRKQIRISLSEAAVAA